jgi:ferric-dicitrate binding protein FerR (iron transport regulator)
LTGEGFFDVKHNPLQPFIIHTGKLVTKVLGTAFNIKAYATDELIEVTVTRGKVQVLKDNNSLALISPGQQVTFNTKTEEYAKQEIDVKQVIAWKPQEILFDDITMEEASKQIEKRFNVKIVFANPDIKNCKVTATFSEDDLPEEIMAVICAVSKASYSITDKNFLINGRGCN